MGAEDWRMRAACRGYDPDLWFTDTKDCPQAQEAVRICRQDCSVRRECGDAAVAVGERHGIVAGFHAKFAREWKALHTWLGINPEDQGRASGRKNILECHTCKREFATTNPDETRCYVCRQDLVSVAPVRAHILRLRTVGGLSNQQIGAAAGISGEAIRVVMSRQDHIRRATAERILAVTGVGSAVPV